MNISDSSYIDDLEQEIRYLHGNMASVPKGTERKSSAGSVRIRVIQN